MAMVFTYRVLENAARNYVLQISGTDAAATTAAQRNGQATGIIAANGYTPTVKLKVREISLNTQNCIAQIQWHATTNVDIAVLSGYHEVGLDDTMGIWNNSGVGVTGDIDINSIAVATVAPGTNPMTASLNIVLRCIKGV